MTPVEVTILPKSYADYRAALESMPTNQAWMMFISAGTLPDILYDFPLSSLEGLAADLYFDSNGNLVAYFTVRITGSRIDVGLRLCPWDVIVLERAMHKWPNGIGENEFAFRKGKLNKSSTGITDDEWNGMMSEIDAIIAQTTRFFPWWAEEEKA